LIAVWAVNAPLAASSRSGTAVSRTVVAGPLRATVTPDPWHLSFTNGGNRTVLSEVRGSDAASIGALGFSTGGVWFHATRVIADRRDGDAYVATVATDDPLGRRLHVRISPDADGVIRLDASVTGDASATGIAFQAPDPTERYLGFGERSNAVDQRGNDVENYVAEGPYQPDERDLVASFIPPWAYRPRDDATYFPMPWLLSTRGYGVLLDNAEPSSFHLGTDRKRAWSVEVQAATLSVRVFAGPTPRDALRRLTASLGRQPPPAAPYYFGPWFHPSGGDAASIRVLRRADAPASVAQTYTHYLPCGDQRGGDDAQRTALYHAAGLAVTTYFNPMICVDYEPVYDDAAAQGALTLDAHGQPYVYRFTGSRVFTVSQFDFSSPAGSAFYGGLLAEAVRAGYDGWMEDFGEYTPTDSIAANGMIGTQMHNYYPVLYHQAAYQFALSAPRPLVRFNRSGWTGAARSSQVVWGGDPTTDWGFDGLASAVKNGLTMGLSGVSLWGSDIGGFFSLLAHPQLTPELLERWIEFGAASGIMRTEANGVALPPKGVRPQIFDPGVLPVWRRYAKLRTQLYPYLAAAEATYNRTGLPIMRDLALVFPDDPAATAREDEYMFGPDLLTAPVLQPGAVSRSLYVPRGQWIDLWRSASYVPSDGSLRMGAARLIRGGRAVTVPAPFGQLPLLVRAGALIALLPPDVDTLTGYGRAPGLVHLNDRLHRMVLLAWPRGRSVRRFNEEERLASVEGPGRWTLTVHGRATRTYRLQASLSTLGHPLIPRQVSLNGHPLPRSAWRYHPRTHVLRARFRVAGYGRLVVSGSSSRARALSRPRP